MLENQGKTWKDAVLTNNYSKVKSPAAFSTCISEGKKIMRPVNDPITGIKELKSIQKNTEMDPKVKLPGILQDIPGDPYIIHLYNEHGLRLYHDNCKKINHRVYVDATGCFSSEKPNNRPVLQYTMYMDFPEEGKPGFPIAHMISDTHSLRILLNFFNSIRYAYELLKIKSFKIKLFVIDFSWVFLNGIVKVFNECSLKNYMIKCQTILEKQCTKKEIEDFSFVHLCGAHIFRALSKKIGKYANPRASHYFRKCISVLINSTHEHQILRIVKLLAVITKSATQTPEFKQYKSELDTIIKNDKRCIELIENYKKWEEENEVENVKLYTQFHKKSSKLKESCAYFEKVNDIVANLKLSKSRKGEEKNPYYCPRLWKHLESHYLYLIPLWTGLMLSPERYCKEYTLKKNQKPLAANENRASTSTIESFFGFSKTDMLRNSYKRRIPLSKYVTKLGNNMVAAYRAYILNLKTMEAKNKGTEKANKVLKKQKKTGKPKKSLDTSEMETSESSADSKKNCSSPNSGVATNCTDTSEEILYTHEEKFKTSSGREKRKKTPRFFGPNKAKRLRIESASSSNISALMVDSPEIDLKNFETKIKVNKKEDGDNIGTGNPLMNSTTIQDDKEKSNLASSPSSKIRKMESCEENESPSPKKSKSTPGRRKKKPPRKTYSSNQKVKKTLKKVSYKNRESSKKSKQQTKENVINDTVNQNISKSIYIYNQDSDVSVNVANSNNVNPTAEENFPHIKSDSESHTGNHMSTNEDDGKGVQLSNEYKDSGDYNSAEQNHEGSPHRKRKIVRKPKVSKSKAKRKLNFNSKSEITTSPLKQNSHQNQEKQEYGEEKSKKQAENQSKLKKNGEPTSKQGEKSNLKGVKTENTKQKETRHVGHGEGKSKEKRKHISEENTFSKHPRQIPSKSTNRNSSTPEKSIFSPRMPLQNLLFVESHDYPLASTTTSAYRNGDCVAWKENTILTKEDILESLMPKQWVYSGTMNVFFTEMGEYANRRTGEKSIFVFMDIFFQSLVNHTKKHSTIDPEDIVYLNRNAVWEYKLWFIPICMQNQHYATVIFELQPEENHKDGKGKCKKICKIFYLDGKSGWRDQHMVKNLNMLLRFFHELYKNHTKKNDFRENISSLKIYEIDSFEQKNVVSCGVYPCLFLYMITHHAIHKVDDYTCEKFRNYMAARLEIMDIHEEQIKYVTRPEAVVRVPLISNPKEKKEIVDIEKEEMRGAQVEVPPTGQTENEQKNSDYEKRTLRQVTFINKYNISHFKGNLAEYLASMLYNCGSIHYLEPSSESDSDF